MEKLEVGKFTGKAKLAGTALGLGGAMLMTFYKCKILLFGEVASIS